MPFLDLEAVGGVVTKTIFRDPRPGNPPPRIAETPSGMLNSIGLEGPGIEGFLAEKLPRLDGIATRVIVSIGATSPEDFAALAARLDHAERVDALEVNISCPNVKAGGLDMSTHPELARDVIRAVRGATGKPVWAKLTPNVTTISEVGRACLEAGADALSAVNTLVGMTVDVDRRRAVLARGTGGLSGPAIRPVALAKCYELVRDLGCDVIGIGGIDGTRSGLEFLIVGCRAVQIGTAVFADPALPGRIAGELNAYLDARGIASLEAILGTVEIGARPSGSAGDEETATP